MAGSSRSAGRRSSFGRRGSAGYGSAATPELTSAVISDAGGNFSISTLYTCPSSSTQMYLTATQGNPGLAAGTNNTGLALMAALGPCGSLGPSTEILINELTTVGAVWALAPFMTAYDHVGTSATNAIGLTNAFSTAAVLANVGLGTAPGNLAPAGSVVPVAEIDTLANILASCVNTAGGVAGDGSACGKLYTDTTVGGVAPTNTVGAALNIALHPGTNVSALWGLVSATGPFQGLSAAPNDWTVAVSYALGGTAAAEDMAIDSSGNVWLVTGTLEEMGPTGNILATVPAVTGYAITIDPSGNIWTGSGTSISKISPTLGKPSMFPISGFTGVAGMAADGVGNIWYSISRSTTVGELGPSGNTGSGGVTNSDYHPTNVSVDMSGNVWIGNVGSNSVAELKVGGGSVLDTCGSCEGSIWVANDAAGNAWFGYDGMTKMKAGGSYTNYGNGTVAFAGIASPQGVAIDGAENVWVANDFNPSGIGAENGDISEITNAGVAVSPQYSGYLSSTLATPYGIAVDGSGNVWVRNAESATVTEFAGAGVPVVTPLALGVKNGTLGTMP